MNRASAGTGSAIATTRLVAARSEQTLVRDHALDLYQPQFDGLRALAVLTVMVDHFSSDVPNFPLPDWIHLGATGVRLFLVLSGYFITASLRRARGRMDAAQLSFGQTIGAFYWRRYLRIAPAYFVFAGIALILGLGGIRHNWTWVFTGTVNWMIAWTNEWPLTISHLWSVCVQEKFYLLWPLMILILPKRWKLNAINTVAVARTATGFDGLAARFLALPGLVFAGRISYGLYIYHALVAMVFNHWLPVSLRFVIAIPSLRLMVFGMATLAVASISWCLIEQPIN